MVKIAIYVCVKKMGVYRLAKLCFPKKNIQGGFIMKLLRKYLFLVSALLILQGTVFAAGAEKTPALFKKEL